MIEKINDYYLIIYKHKISKNKKKKHDNKLIILFKFLNY